ncbi:MAG: hypothetical protein JNJ47_08300 [Alphaproteobacteria bacterium]|nr:hypothetical protein [Alphaproteobacteria bacterium]
MANTTEEISPAIDKIKPVKKYHPALSLPHNDYIKLPLSRETNIDKATQ